MIFGLRPRFTGQTPIPVPEHCGTTVHSIIQSTIGTHPPLIPTAGMANPECSSKTVESRHRFLRRCLDGISIEIAVEVV